jgi:hypothetical protein
MVDTLMGSKGNLTWEHPKAHMHLQLEICLHHLLKVLRHLGVHFHLGIHLHLEVHHLLPKVHSPLSLVLNSHEEDYHHFL